MIQFTIDPAWKEVLEANGLGDFESIHRYRAGECLSSHSRAQIYRGRLKDGQTVFVKQDNFTKLKIILRYLLRGQKPMANTEKERRCYILAEEHGIRSVKTIAYGQELFMGIFPGRGVMVNLPVEGIPLDDFCRKCPDAERRRQAIANAEAVLTHLQDCGLDWTVDCKPEHFFVSEKDLSISLIDLERLKERGKPLDKDYREMQFRRFRSLLP